MKKIVLIYLFSIISLFAYETKNGEKIFTANDFEIAGTCKPTCRAVNTNYKTVITGFNPFTGITNCIAKADGGDDNIYQVKDINSETVRLESNGLIADTFNPKCVQETSVKQGYSNLTTKNKNFNSLINSNYMPNKTFSHFLVGLMTLDDDIVDFKTTASTVNFALNSATF